MRMQIGGLKGSLEWDDLCIPNREDVAIFQQRGAGDFDLLNGRVAQQVESKKVCALLMPLPDHVLHAPLAVLLSCQEPE